MSFVCTECGEEFHYANGGLDCFKCGDGPYCYNCVTEHKKDCDE
jgi:hypothetical protein